MLRPSDTKATLLLALLLSAAACSSEAPAEGPGPSPGHAEPPGPGPAAPPDGQGNVTFAIRRFFLGDTDRDGTPDLANGWKQFGYDLDGLASTASSTGLCKPRDGALPDDVYPDGDEGRDNAFGRSILPILLGVAPDLSVEVDGAIEAGASTALVRLEQLGASPDENPLVARYYRGGDVGAPPLFDGSDVWPVSEELLQDPNDIDAAKVVFSTSYLTGDTWVGRPAGDLPLRLAIGDIHLDLTISHAVISMHLDAARAGAGDGTIAGTLSTDALVAAMLKMAADGEILAGFCAEPPVPGVVEQLEKASDILADTTQDPDKECDAISIGIGFDAVAVQLGPIVAEAPPPQDPCAGAPSP